MLKIRFTDNSAAPFWVMEKQFTIGRAKSNNLTLDTLSVDDSHARIIHRGDTFLLKDLGSSSGTFVNNTRITQRNIGCGDLIQVGDITLEVVDPFLQGNEASEWALIADSSWLTGQEFPLHVKLNGNPVVLGRSKECDVVIPGTHLSRQHAEIILTDAGLQIYDLGSANGTYVNDKRVNTATLVAGDRVRVDVYSFKVFGPGINLPRAATQTLKAVTDTMVKIDPDTEQPLWQTRPTSPGNREQENLYKTKWLPATVAISLLLAFCGMVIYVIFGE